MKLPVARADVNSAPPVVDTVAPGDLQVDERYQRSLSRASLRLIEKVVAGWDWRRFKPPVVVKTSDGYHVIDGQHTAIAAVTHGGIPKIPVLVIAAESIEDRAKAFVGHNRDRVNVTPHQIFHAAIAAGDEEALTIQQVCERAGVRVLRAQPNHSFEPGDTLAISTLRSLVNKRHALGARQVLQVLADAKCAPITPDLIKAVDELLFASHYKGSIKSEDLSTIIRAGGFETETKQLAAAKSLPFWRALVIVLSNRRPRRGYRSTA
ncbi:MAG: hypothetical protein KGL46_03880 [Hyphomicrobiales bacterium]|nr:hypothetical protein [Hyphomicrobiales bacterium]